MMKKTEIRSLLVSSSINQYKDESVFCVQISIDIGVKGEVGADTFFLRVCSPKWLDTYLSEPTSGYGMLIMRDFDLQLVEKWARKTCEISFEGDWNQAVELISQYMVWEFSNYQG